MRGSTQSRSFCTFFIVSLLVLALAATSAPAAQDSACDWQRGDLHKMHWPQTPDLSADGTAVSLSQAILADDFRCSGTGPVRDIHIWASFLDDALPKEGPASLTVELRIYADVPGDGKVRSRPGELLWSQTFSPGTYTLRKVHDGPGNGYDPTTGEYWANNHRQTYQYNFCATEPFVQQEGTVYWLGVGLAAPNIVRDFGWKTTGRQWQWNDRAVYQAQNSEDWLVLEYPLGHQHAGQALDLAFIITSGESAVADCELGDAPDHSNSLSAEETLAYPSGVVADFPTVYQAGSPPCGPLHLMPRDAFYLGRWVSLENEADLGPDEDAVNNLHPATGVANRDGADDGLQWPVVMPSCQQTTLDYVVTATSNLAGRMYVNVWCDWNRDGDWNDTIRCPDGAEVPEWAVQDDRPFIPELGTFTLTTPAFLCWHPETAGASDPLWLRITVSERPWAGDPAIGGSGPEEGYNYGETEDYYLQPKTEPTLATYDWGDALDSSQTPGYPTLAVHDGAQHAIGGPWFGDALDRPDAEAEGLPDADALGDDTDGSHDENGVSISPLVQGQRGSITFEINGGGGVVQAWIDFNADHAWQDDEQVISGFLPDGIHSVPLAVPEFAAVGRTFARLRISTGGGLSPHGPASDGEVEDHPVWIRPVPVDAKWCQWPDLTVRGLDVRVDSNNAYPRLLADDFECTSQDRLTLIRLWGSWKNDQQGQIERIRVSIHPDDPAGQIGSDTENPFSKPSPETLWEKVFFTGQYNETLYHVAQIARPYWWDMTSDDLRTDSDAQVWQIDLKVNSSEAFLQSGSPEKPQTYWLAVAVETSEGQFGWKTHHWPEHHVSDAVLAVGNKLPRSWQELRYPDGHPCYDLEMNSVDMAFCLMYTRDEPEQPTSRPGSVTQCPVVETQCPATTTHCPTMPTLCPAVETRCPAMATRCPALETQCPTSETTCPGTLTHCPAVETRCPATQTQCPAMNTMCPAVNTKCPAGATQCPALETHCPPSPTTCPTSVTKCPTVETRCPTTETKCPTTMTACPAIATKCPSGLTYCPAIETRCPAAATKCPATATECPVAQTQCPATSTECPAFQTRCPAVSTKCPMDVTKCPIACPAVSGTASMPGTTVVASDQTCPAVDAKCPTIAEYLAVVTAR